VNFKFGVLYAKDGQLTDDEMFSNGEFFILFFIVLFIQIKKCEIVPTHRNQKGCNGYVNTSFVRFFLFEFGEKL